MTEAEKKTMGELKEINKNFDIMFKEMEKMSKEFDLLSKKIDRATAMISSIKR
jgi:hypothetical protein